MALIRPRTLGYLLAVLTVITRIGCYIFTPLWLDAFNDLHGNGTENSTNGSLPDTSSHKASVFFLIMMQAGVQTLVFGAVLLLILLFQPGRIGEEERTYPKSQFVLPGFAQGLSTVLFNYALSATRTALYLQAVLSNFNIPIQFSVRFLILKKRPSLPKFVCALIIVIAEFICLLPKMFPSLEPDSGGSSSDTGASGVAGVLWPMCFVSSMVPFAVANSIMEKNVQKQQSVRGRAVSEPSELNLFYFLFWFNLSTLLTVVALFWLDVLPGFGTSQGLHQFVRVVWFDFRCLFGGACSLLSSLYGFLSIGAACLTNLAFVGSVRYTEGGNFVIMLLTVRTPILFLMWTLFEEHDLHWSPHARLSTWLSLAAIVVMLPAVVVYNRASPERLHSATVVVEEDISTLLPPGEEEDELQPDLANVSENSAEAPLLTVRA